MAHEETIRALATETHVERPCAAEYDGKMLYSIYSDGEMTLQKAGPHCWGRRTEHVVELGDAAGRKLPIGVLPRSLTNGFDYVIVDLHADAARLRSMIIEEIRRSPGRSTGHSPGRSTGRSAA